MSILSPKWNNNRESVLKDRYTYKSENNYSEIIDRIVKEVDVGIYNELSDFKFIPAGRMLAGIGTDTTKTFFNCYVIGFRNIEGKGIDSRKSISNLFERAFEISARGGGIGINWSVLRPKSSYIKKVNGKSTGPLAFMESLNSLIENVSQGGSRRGAQMYGLETWHPDILDFIEIKNDLSRINSANLSVFVSDDFMEAVKNDEDWYLEFPDTTYKYYDDEWDGDLNLWKSKDYPIIHYDTVRARDIFNKIAKYAHDTGEPGMIFLDRANKYNIPNKDEKLIGTNPCVTGDTKILTDNGYKRIDKCLYKSVNVWNGEEFSEVQPKITSKNEKILKFKLSTGEEIKTTYYHGFILNDGTEVEAQDLEVGDKLCKWERPIIEGYIYKSEKWAYSQGFFAGDGSDLKNAVNQKPIDLYNEKMKLEKYLDYTSKSSISKGNGDSKRLTVQLNINGGYKDKDFVPTAKYTKEVRLNWLAGIIDSDGSINDKGGSVSISSINRDFLLNIKYMIDTLGLNGSLIVEKEGGTKTLPDGNGSEKEYNVNTSYRLILSAYTVMKLREMGLNTHRVDVSIANPNRRAARFPQITSIEKQDSIEDKVYCFNEHKLHTGVFNGLRTSQCGEQPLSEDSVCNLGAINLTRFIDFDTKKTNYEELKNTIHKSVEFLDEVIELNPYYQKRTENHQINFRKIGLGFMGLADYLILKELKYGSDKSLEEINSLMKFISNEAFRKSALLAKSKGKSPIWNKYMLDNKYIRNLDEDVYNLIEKYGLRNTRLLTVAPTGSTSVLAGVSSGIEPNFAYEMERDDRIGKREDIHWIYPQKEELKIDEDVFVEASDLSYTEHIKVQAEVQKYIDSSISKTINAPEDSTIKDTKDAFMFAYDTGCKGITYYRDGSRTGVLRKIDDVSEKSITDLEKKFKEAGDSVISNDVKIPKEPPVKLYKRKDNNGKKWYFFIAFADRNYTRPFALFIKTNNYTTGDVADWIISKMERLVFSKGIDEEIIDEQTKKYSGQSNPDKIARSIGLALRHNIKIKDIVDVLDSCEPEFSSLLFHIKKLLINFIANGTKTGEKCPKCGEDTIYKESCVSCSVCYWSKC